jgi:tetratricopeptide (TPR) repeat protein
VHLALGEEKEAEAALLSFLEIRPKADVLQLLAQILIKNRRLEEAAALLDQAERLEPRHGGVHIARGDLLLATGQVEKAVASYTKAAKVDPHRARELAAARKAMATNRVPTIPERSAPSP